MEMHRQCKERHRNCNAKHRHNCVSTEKKRQGDYGNVGKGQRTQSELLQGNEEKVQGTTSEFQRESPRQP